MKKSLFCLAAVLICAPASILFAQDTGTTNSPSVAAPSGNDGAGAPENGQRGEKWKAVLEQLNLSDGQKQQIKQIRVSTQAGPDRRKQIMAVLSPDQKQKLISMLQEYRAEQAGQ